MRRLLTDQAPTMFCPSCSDYDFNLSSFFWSSFSQGRSALPKVHTSYKVKKSRPSVHNLGRVRNAGLGYPTRTCFPYLRPVWAYQREARWRLVTPIYHAEASAQAEALASATTGSQASQSKQGKRGRGRLGDSWGVTGDRRCLFVIHCNTHNVLFIYLS